MQWASFSENAMEIVLYFIKFIFIMVLTTKLWYTSFCVHTHFYWAMVETVTHISKKILVFLPGLLKLIISSTIVTMLTSQKMWLLLSRENIIFAREERLQRFPVDNKFTGLNPSLNSTNLCYCPFPPWNKLETWFSFPEESHQAH